MRDLITRTITGFGLGAFFWAAFTFFAPFYFSCLLFIILLLIVVFEWHHFFARNNPLFWLIMPFYPILPFTLLITMNQHILYRELLFYLVILVFSFDVGSYFSGSLFGKHKLAPSISPGKTWEGAFGGYVSAIFAFKIMLFYYGIQTNIFFALLVIFIICLLALLGDLFESWLKRCANIKDSGTFLPGHGGFLDRFDGILFAVLFFYIYRDYLIKLFGIV